MAISESEFLSLVSGDVVHLIRLEDAIYQDSDCFRKIGSFFGTDVVIQDTEDYGVYIAPDQRFRFSIDGYEEKNFLLSDIDYIVRGDDREFANDVDLNMLF